MKFPRIRFPGTARTYVPRYATEHPADHHYTLSALMLTGRVGW